jgi:hypothetical protein
MLVSNDGSRHESSILQEQRELIQTLLEEKRVNDKRFRQLTERLEFCSDSDEETLIEEREPPSRELRKYCHLIAKMLSDIDACKSDLESARNRRMTTDIFGMHAVELEHFESTHGRKAVDFIRNRVSQLYDGYVSIAF